MSSYISLRSKLTGRCTESRKVGNNTYIVNRDWKSMLDGTLNKAVAVRFHNTDIVTFYEDGRIVISHNGWKTNTTRERFSRFMPDGFFLSAWKVYKDALPWINPDSFGVDFDTDLDLSVWDDLVVDQTRVNQERAIRHAEEVKANRADGAHRGAQTRWLRKNYPWAEDYADELTDDTRQAIIATQRYSERTVNYANVSYLGDMLRNINEGRLAAESRARREIEEAAADAAFEAEERRIMEEADRINRMRYQAHLAAFTTGVTQ